MNVENVITKINNLLWGDVLVVFILCVGIYTTVGLKFLQINVPKIFKYLFSKRGENVDGDISPFAALNVALGGTVGVGNIAGVATAISLGGPGAIFWMWVSGLVGMATKFTEVVLGVHYRVREKDGPMLGGPMMYIKYGLPKWLHLLAYLFAIFAAVAALGIGNMAQANSVAVGAEELGIPRYITGLVLIFAVGLVTIGGIKRIAEVATICVPVMCGVYFLAAIVIIFFHITKLPQSIILIFTSAFSTKSLAGGIVAATFKDAIRYGIARGLFSNEAGLGSAPIAHSTAITDHPVRQGFFGMFEVFIDTIIICTITALAIIVTDCWQTGQTAAVLTMNAFSKTFGVKVGSLIVVGSMILTAYDTNLAWCFYGESCSAFLFGHQARIVYRFLWLPFVLIGAMGKLEVIWNICDVLNALMALPNLIAILFLAPVVFNLTKNFITATKESQNGDFDTYTK